MNCYRLFTLAVAGICILSGCAPSTRSLEPDAVRASVSEDLKSVYQHADVKESLRLEDALARALRYNLDIRVAELDELIAADDVSLETLNALPTVRAKAQRIGRNNPGGSSSFSLLTGTQSLQPSISTDQYRNTAQLDTELNLLDAGIALGRAKSASDKVLIAQERRRKVYHDVVQDAYTAFWRAAAAQSALPIIDDLLAQTKEQISRIDQQIKESIVPLGEARANKSKLIDRRQQLMGMKQGLLLPEIELKTLIDYPLNQPIKLDLGGKDWLATVASPRIKGDISQLEETAFLNRPEVREEILNKRISLRDIRMSIIETFPGVDLILNFNRDSNSFLANKTWVDGIVGLTQSINKIITAPARYDRAKNLDVLADRRRQALIAAVITQVHVAKMRFDFLSEAYDESIDADKNAAEILNRAKNFNATGLMSGADLLNARIDAEVSAINRSLAFAGIQDAYGRFITTMGVDLWDADSAGLSVPDFARQIKTSLSNENIFLVEPAAGEGAK